MSWNNLHPGLVMILFGIIILALPEKCRKYLTLAGSVCAFCVFWMLDSHSTLPFKVTDNLTLQLIDTNGVSMVFLMVFVSIGVINAIYAVDLQNKWEAGITCIYAGSNMGIVLAVSDQLHCILGDFGLRIHVHHIRPALPAFFQGGVPIRSGACLRRKYAAGRNSGTDFP